MTARQTASTEGQAGTSVGQGIRRIERKFFIRPGNIGFAYTLLRQICRPDREYPLGQVNTLYFDTPDLEQLTRSASGDSRKDKVRFRWYDRVEDYRGTVPGYLELKTRQGFSSSKQRRRLLLPAHRLETGGLRAGIVDRTTMFDTLAGFGHFPETPLRPVIVVSYLRHRFTEDNQIQLDCLECLDIDTKLVESLPVGELLNFGDGL